MLRQNRKEYYKNKKLCKTYKIAVESRTLAVCLLDCLSKDWFSFFVILHGTIESLPLEYSLQNNADKPTQIINKRLQLRRWNSKRDVGFLAFFSLELRIGRDGVLCFTYWWIIKINEKLCCHRIQDIRYYSDLL